MHPVFPARAYNPALAVCLLYIDDAFIVANDQLD
jgi:hypothetical protein